MRQFFIMLVGFSRSGKSTLAKKILNSFPGRFVKIDSDTILNFLNKTYPIFKDDNTVMGKSYELRQKVTKAIHKSLIDIFLSDGQSIILDSCNLSQEKRKKILHQVKTINRNIVSVIIYNKISEKQLFKNLQKADQQLIKKRKKPAWVELYKKIQKPKFEEPTANEAKYLLIYKKESEKSVFTKLKQILK